MTDNEPVSVEIIDFNDDAVKGPAGAITIGCFTFDAVGGRHKVTRVRKTKKTITLAHNGSDEDSVTWSRDEEVTYVPHSMHEAYYNTMRFRNMQGMSALPLDTV